MADKEFPAGIFFNEKRSNAPEWVKGSVSIKVEDAIPYLQSKVNAGGYVNINLLVSKLGKAYCELDTWTPDTKKTSSKSSEVSTIDYPEDDDTDDGIPF